ncbi:MAG: hypothetical protein ABI343_14655 [Burkholderiaceae bacterium]
MPHLKLISNGNYHVMVTADGTGYSQCGKLAVTRWREDAALDDCGTFCYLRDDADGRFWSTSSRPTLPRADTLGSHFDDFPTTLQRRDDGIEARTEIAVALDGDVELRRLRVRNRSNRRRTLSATSYAEIVLAAAATDAAHPAFSKLFVETEIDSANGAILAKRRPSAPQDPHPWLFHQAVVQGRSGQASYETDRSRFLGRGRDTVAPLAMAGGGALSGHAGPVLDAIAAIRIPFELAPGETLTIDWLTGVATSRADCLALADRYRTPDVAQHILAQAASYRRSTLRRIHADAAQGRVFERLAGAIVHAGATLRGDAEVIGKNERGQSGLWGFAISGDWPVVLLRLQGVRHLALARKLVRAQAFWSAHGIRTEMMILCTPSARAQRPPQSGPDCVEQVRRALVEEGHTEVLDKPGGVFIRDSATLDDGDRALLESVARIVITDSAGSLAAQARRADAKAWHLQYAPEVPPGAPALPMEMRAVKGTSHATAGAHCMGGPGQDKGPAIGELFGYNGHGGFSEDLREYVVSASASHMTPAPWTNVIANPDFGTLVSESGSACTWSENSHEFRLTPWSNDPVSDPNAEAFYIRDEDSTRFWSPTLLPTRTPGSHVARHGFGYSTFEHMHDEIASTLCTYVAIDAPVKFYAFTLRNLSKRPRRLSVTGCLDWVLGDERGKTLMQVVTEIDGETGALFARNGYNTDFAGRTAFFDVEGQDRSVCGGRADFFGPQGTRATPAALAQPRLSGCVGAALDPCAALRVTLDLAPGQESALVFRLGAGHSSAQARELVQRWRGDAAAQAALEAVHAYWQRTLGTIQVHTPERAVDALANGWLIYQVIASRLWGRTAFYQSSGAYGFRDQLQDVMALVHAEPALVRAHLLRSAARQFVEGDVQHWWHPPSGKGIRTRCSDDYLWLVLATCRYVNVTGDVDVLKETCPFLSSRPLKDGEASNYELPQRADEVADLYEHCVRAIRHGLRFGAHGLPLMGTGDWNDGMNLVGAEGKGESVWMAFFLITVLARFAPLARERDDPAFAERCDTQAARLRESVESAAWDGQWYQRAWFDDGSVLGSAANAECQIDSIAQSWSALSGAAPPRRAEAAMDSVYQRLVHADTRLVQLLDPPFDKSDPSPGYIQGYVPGVRENGGQYTHAAVWSAMAFAALGDADRAWELFGMLAPVGHGASASGIAVYKVEPYVVAGDVYAFDPHAGRGGWSWYTGSAGWMYQLLVESLLGLSRKASALQVRPLIPRDWDGFEIGYRFGATRYDIHCHKAASQAQARVTLDGAELPDGTIPLRDDGGPHAVSVAVWRDDQARAR